MENSRLLGQAGHVLDVITPNVLTVSRYRRLWLSGIIYYQAFWMEIVVTGWVVLELTGSASAVGQVAFFRTVPMLIFGLVFGSLADRFPRIRVLFAIQTVSLMVAGTLVTIFLLNMERFWLLCVLSGVIGCAWAADYSSRRALISELNTPETTANAMSLEALSMQSSKGTAPIVGGFILGIGGATVAYFFLTLLFAADILALLRLREQYSGTGQIARSTVSLPDLIRSGWSTAVRIPVVRLALLVTVVMNLLIFPYQHLIALVAGEILSVGPGRMGVLAGVAGVGAATMAGFLTFRGRPSTARLFYVGGATLGAVLLIGLAISTSYPVSLALQLMLGMCFGAFSAMQPALIVNAVEPEMRARAMGLLAMAIGTMPLGILITGTLSSLIGVSLTIGGMALLGSVLLVTTVFRYRSLLRG